MKNIAPFFLLIIIVFTSCNDQKEDVVNKYYPDGNIMSRMVYETQKKKRVLVKEIQYYENGNVKLEGEYQNGKRNGRWIQWYENGQTWSEGQFEEDIREGKSVVYHMDGKINYTGFYRSGKPDGEWNFYNENEKIVKKVVYDVGKIIEEENFQVPFN